MKGIGLTACLLLAAAASSYSSPVPDEKVGVYPTGYRLDLHPYPGDGVFKGRVRIDIAFQASHNAQAVSEIRLNADPSLNVIDKDVKVTRLADLDSSEEEDDESDEDTALSVSQIKREGDDYVVHLSQKLHCDSMYQLDLSFEGTLELDPSKTFYQNSYLDSATNENRWFVVLNLKPGNARKVFPCFDDPKHKTWIELSVSHKKELHVLTSMPLTDVSNVTTDGVLVKDQFGRTPPMSVGSLALLVSDFQQAHVNYLETDGIRIGVWGRKDFVTALTKSQQLLPSVIVSLEIFLSRPYPLPQLNMVALPNYTAEAYINSWGLQLFRESDLMNGNTYWLSHRLAKAAATQWLIHLTTPSNETAVTQALASFLASAVAKQNGVALGLDQLDQFVFYDWHVRSYHGLYLELSKPHSYTKENHKSLLAISKGQLLLQMLEHTLGTSTFKVGIQNFLSNREFKMYTDDDLWAAMTEQARTDGTLAEPVTVKDIANSWLSQERIPLVTALRHYNNNSVSLTQEPFVNSLETRLGMTKIVKKPSAPDEFWWIPLVIVRQDGANWTASKPAAWLQPHQYEMNLPLTETGDIKDQFIVLNPGNIGLFLVNYDTDNWKKLTEHVSTMPDSVRTQLLHDSLTLALAGKLDTVTALNLTLFLKAEQNPVVWKTFYPLADRLRKMFLGTAASGPFEAYLQALILPPLEAVGEEADKTSPWRSDFRVKTRHLLCSTNFPNCIEHARAYYSIWVNTSKPDEGMPIANIHLCPVFAYGTYEEWDFGLQRLIHFSPNRSMSERSFLLKTLAGCSRNAEKYKTLLNLTFLDEAANETFSDADRYAILASMATEPTGYSALYLYLKENFMALKQGLQGNLWEFFIQMAMSQFKCQPGLDNVSQLYEERKGQFGGAEKKAEESVESVKMRVRWAEEKIPAIECWLNATMASPWKPQRFRFEDSMTVTRSRKFG